MSHLSNIASADPREFWRAIIQHRITHIHGSSRLESITQARTTIDDELAAMHLAMCTLRTRRNALIPISFLPPEILIQIFRFCADISLPLTENQHPLDWIEVTHVCRAWRETALNCPGLWSDVCLDLGPRWADLMLNRTKGIPISICQSTDPSEYQCCSRVLRNNFHRVRHLELFGSSLTMQPAVTSLPSLPNTLETLELSSEFCYLGEESTEVQLPNEMANNHVPSLRRLVLRGFWVPWSAPLLYSANLKHLEIKLDAPGHGQAINFLAVSSCDDILFALENMHSLEVLKFDWCFPSELRSIVVHPVLSLPRLKKLSLEGPAIACLTVTGRLKLQPACQRYLLYDDYPQLEDITQAFPILRDHIHFGPDLPPLHTVMISRLRQGGFCVKLWRSYEALPESRPFDPLPDPDLWVWLPPSEESPITALKFFCEALPLDIVRTIIINLELEECFWRVREWISILGQCKAVTKARIEGDFALSMCRALAGIVDWSEGVDEDGETEHHHLLPNLLELSIFGVHFERWSSNSGGYYHDMLRRCLEEGRDRHERPQLSVHLDSCSIKPQWVRALEEVVVVCWDGDEGLCLQDWE